MNRYLRVQRKTLQTATVRLEHADTHRRVLIVGTFHVAESTYYEQIGDLLARHAAAGERIQYEGIRRDVTLETDQERQYLDMLDGVPGDSRARLGVLLGWVTQASHLRYPAEAQNVDMSAGELRDRLGRRLFEQLTLNGKLTIPRNTWWSRARSRRYLRKLLRTDGITGHGPDAVRRRHVLIDERDEIAYLGATRALAHGDVVLVWGAGHLPGIVERFTRDGYSVSDVTWLTVGRL